MHRAARLAAIALMACHAGAFLQAPACWPTRPPTSRCTLDGSSNRLLSGSACGGWRKSGGVVRLLGSAGAGDGFVEELGGIDAEQAALMMEECILVDREDRPTGRASKVETHLVSEGLKLHRAFSVFLFDKKGRMLLQRRAGSKHTFPLFWTNTCCSHPLWTEEEMGLDQCSREGGDRVSEGEVAILGSKRAAVRKLGHELGIPKEQLPLDGFVFLTKVHYLAASGDTWGEHEIDYVFLVQADVDLAPNDNEVAETAFLDREGLRRLLAQADASEVELTPWSRYIIDKFVFQWWDHLGDKARLSAFRDDQIHRVGQCEYA